MPPVLAAHRRDLAWLSTQILAEPVDDGPMIKAVHGRVVPVADHLRYHDTVLHP